MFILVRVILFLSYFQCSVNDSKWFKFHLIKCVALKGFVNNFALLFEVAQSRVHSYRDTALFMVLEVVHYSKRGIQINSFCMCILLQKYK